MSDIAGIISRVWPEWTIEKQIGRGAFGQVFQAVRGELGFETRCAIKAVEVPPDDSETDALRLEGMTEEEIRQYFRRQAESFVGEIRMLDSLKGAPHIVGIEDFRVVEQEDGLSWVILIRMELLTPFPVYVRSAPMTEAETVRLGIELCKAMEICHGLHVIHRDIKPQNIFVDRFGSFRLGDFGIARKMESLTNSMSKKGTYGYLAPEINNGFHYDERVDIYSLGLVMYQLVNENRMPFLSTPEDARNPEKRSSAMERRLRGEPLPPPCAASPALADVILKACRYDPNDRFRTASDMKNALLALESGTEADLAHAPQIPVKPAETVPEEPHPAAEAAPEEPADDEATLSPRSAMRKRAAEASEKTAARDEDTERTVRAASERTRTGSDASARKSSGKKPGPGKKQILIAVLALLLLSASVFGIASLSRRSAPDGTNESGRQTADNARTDTETPETEPVYTLEPVSGEGGAVLMEPGSAKLGDRVTLTAHPEEGYVFSGWTADGIELEKPADEAENSFVLTSPDYRLEARFDILHRLEAENRPENLTVRFSPEQAKLGDTVEVTAEPDAGYRFVGWEAEGLTLDRPESEAENSFTLTSDEFSLKALAEPIKYAVWVESDGSGTAEADKAGAVMGERITLKATPTVGYVFKEWKVISGGVTVKDNALTVGTEDVRVRAVFEEVPYTITVSVDGQGSASADKSSAVRGDKITLKATPADGYYLKDWVVLSGGAEVKDNAVTVGTEDVRILAVFEPKQSRLALVKPADAQVDARFFTTVEEKWFKAYSAKMDEFIGYCPDARFGFIHLDSDHIPELVCCGREKVQYETWLPDSYTPDSMVDYYDVYTIRNGQVESPAFCYGGPFEYVARSGRYRFLHLYAAFSMDYYIYDNMIDQEFGNDGYVVRDPDLTGGKTSVLVIGFEDPDPVLGGWSERTLSADQYLELMKTYYPVTADALEDVEVSGASYTVRRDLLAPKSELNILK